MNARRIESDVRRKWFGEQPPSLAQRNADLLVLQQCGLIRPEETDYWRENAVTGRICDGAKVGDLLERMAKAVGATGGRNQQFEILTKRGIIWNDYWKDNAISGGACNGEYVGNLIRAAAGPIGDDDILRRFPVRQGLISSPTPTPLAGASSATYNLIIGTQTIGAAYQFTKLPLLQETAQAILAMGASVIKFDISSRYSGKNGNVPSPRTDIDTLTKLVRDEPTHRLVFQMPFADYVLWAHTFSGGGQSWLTGLTPTNRDKEYREMYDITCHLLKTYSGTGKRFFLGHWEGDGWLRGSIAPENDLKVTPIAVRGMIDWLNIRQKAIEDARRATSHHAVQVWHYTEVNHVKIAMQGRKSVVSEVLPHVNVDFVSYSSYDTAADPALLKAALSYIESRLQRNSELIGKRVFIGEYGFPTAYYSAREQERLSRQVMRAALEWGCPFVLYWELYNNEKDEKNGQKGFWLIDDRGVKQPVYETHARFLQQARDFTSKFQRERNRLPSSDEFRRAALSFLLV